MTRDDASGAFVVARMDVRARLRRIRTQPRKLFSLLGLGMFFGVVAPWFVRGPVRAFGRAVASGTPPVGTTAAVLLGVAGWGAYVGGATAMNRDRLGALGPLLRTSLAPRAVAGGRLLGEVASMLVATVVPIPVTLALVGAGAGSALAPVVLVVGALPVLVASLAVGRALVAAVRLAGLFSRVGAWTKAVLLVVVSGGFYLGSQSFVRDAMEQGGSGVAVAIDPFLPGTPMQAYASLVLSPFGSSPSLVGVGLLVASVALTVAGVAGTLTSEVRMLSRDADGTAERDTSGSRDVPRAFAFTPAGRVAWRRLLRTARDPKSLAHLFPLSFVVFGTAASWANDPASATAMAPGGGVVLGGAFAGAAFCLNPLGDDRDQLPLLLSSVRSTGVLLRGRALAGATVGLAFAAIGIAGGSFTGDYLRLAGFAGFAVLFVAGATGTALGLGALFPRFERREYMNVERAHPSTVLVIVYFFGTVVMGVLGAILVTVTVSDGVDELVLGGWAVYLVVTAVTGLGGYLLAVRRFDALTLDDV